VTRNHNPTRCLVQINRTVTLNVVLTHDEVIAAILRYVREKIDADIENPDVLVYEGEPFAFYGKVTGVVRESSPVSDPYPTV